MIIFTICSDYDNYFNVLEIEAQPDQSLFWSGTFELVGLVSCMCSTGADVVSSRNTPSSTIFNNIGRINWCGTRNISSPGALKLTHDGRTTIASIYMHKKQPMQLASACITVTLLLISYYNLCP